jgi:hypothetical protein
MGKAISIGSKKNMSLRIKHVQFARRSKRSVYVLLLPEGKIAMAQANLRLVEGTFMDKTKAVAAALSQFEGAFGNDSLMRLGKNESTGLSLIDAIEPETELFALALQLHIL